MNKKRVYLFSVVIISLVFVFGAKETFSQDNKSSIRTFTPGLQQQQFGRDVLIKQWAEYYKKSYGINELYIYKAVALNLPSACDISADRKRCLNDMDELLEIYNLATGRCKAIELEDRDVCIALRKNDCSALVDKGDKKQCEGYLDLDFLAIREKFRIERDQINIKSELRLLAYYSAFKNNNVLACLQLLKDDDYCHKIGCYMLTNSDSQSIIDKFALDFAYYYYAEVKNKKSTCNNISDDYIRKHCAKGTIFSHFVDTYFLGN